MKIVSRYPTSEHFSLLEKLSLFKDLAPDVKEIFIKNSNVISIETSKNASNELLLENKIYILLEGNAFLSSIERDGKKIIIDALKEGNIFGCVEGFEEETDGTSLFIEPFSKETIKVCEFERSDFLNILKKSPSLALNVFLNLTSRMSRLEKKIEEMTFMDLETRLLTELGRLGHPLSSQQNPTIIVTGISQERLAQILGVVRETITKTFSKLKRSGVILPNRKSLIIRMILRKKEV